MKKYILTLTGVLALAAVADAQFGVTIRTRNGAGAAVDRFRIETGVASATIRLSDSFIQVDGIGAPALSPAGSGRIFFNGVQFQVSQNGGAFVPMIPAGGVASVETAVGAVDLVSTNALLTVAFGGGSLVNFTVNEQWVDTAGDTMTGNLTMDNQTDLRLREATANGTNFIAHQAPALLGVDTTYTWPAAPVAGNFLQTDGLGNLSWIAAGGGGSAWATFVTPLGVNPTADAAGDTLTWTAGAGISITGANDPESITIAVPVGGITSALILDLTVGTADIAAGAVTMAKITEDVNTWVNITGDTMTNTLNIFPTGPTAGATGIFITMPAGAENAGVFQNNDSTGSGASTVWGQQIHGFVPADLADSVGVLGLGLNATFTAFEDAIAVEALALGFNEPVMATLTATGAPGELAFITAGDTLMGLNLGAGSGGLTVFGAKLCAQNTPDGWIPFYCTEALDSEFTASGSAVLDKGSATIALPKAFVDSTEEEIPYKIIITPSGACNGVFVSGRSHDGFSVAELGGGTSNASFDYIVIGRRGGYAVRPSHEEFDARLDRFSGDRFRKSREATIESMKKRVLE